MNTLGMRQCDIGKDPEILSVIQKWMVNISKILEYRKQPIFPVGEKLIAPGMQRIDENASFQVPKSSGCRPNLREWWVGERISLGDNERQWVVNCVRQSKKDNDQFDLPCEGGKSEIGSFFHE